MEYWTKSGIMPCHAMSYHTTSGSPCEWYLGRFVRSDHGKGIAAREGNGREEGKDGHNATLNLIPFHSIQFDPSQCDLIQFNSMHLDCDLPVASNINLSFSPNFSSGMPKGEEVRVRVRLNMTRGRRKGRGGATKGARKYRQKRCRPTRLNVG